jgi:hypothetical protein
MIAGMKVWMDLVTAAGVRLDDMPQLTFVQPVASSTSSLQYGSWDLGVLIEHERLRN